MQNNKHRRRCLNPFQCLSAFKCLAFVVVCLAAMISVGCNQVDGPVAVVANQSEEVSANQDIGNDSGEKVVPVVPAELDPSSDSDLDVEVVADPAANGGVQVADPPRDPALVQQQKKDFSADGVLELTFDDLKFDIEVGDAFEREMLSEEVESLDNRQIKIRGYIKPSFKMTGLKGFVFVRDDKECCFGPQAAIYDCVIVKLAKGTTTEYTVRPVTIEGKFYLKEYEGPDGTTWAIFKMRNTKVLK